MSAASIDAFWKWWQKSGAAFARGFDDGSGPKPALTAAMSKHVAAIHESLDWEFGKGVRSRHHLCLSGKGDPVLRVITERWVKRGPGADATWEFYPARQPSPGAGHRLEIAGHTVDLDAFTFSVTEDESRETLDIVAHHPVFKRIRDAKLRTQVLYLTLDDLLGEDGAERWLGAVDESRTPFASPVRYSELRARVEDLGKRATGERWAILKGTPDGKPVFITTNLALKRIDHLLFDMHLTVAIRLLTVDPNGLMSKEEGDALTALEDRLVPALGPHGVLVGHETGRGLRTIHLRVMEGGPARGIVDGVVSSLCAGRATVTPQLDPRWDAVRAWR
ncbi:MAG TPA: DUF695 domain-containing protein [Polyangiaceae bacterium]